MCMHGGMQCMSYFYRCRAQLMMAYINPQHVVDSFGVLVLPSNEDPQQSGDSHDNEMKQVA